MTWARAEPYHLQEHRQRPHQNLHSQRHQRHHYLHQRHQHLHHLQQRHHLFHLQIQRVSTLKNDKVTILCIHFLVFIIVNLCFLYNSGAEIFLSLP